MKNIQPKNLVAWQGNKSKIVGIVSSIDGDWAIIHNTFTSSLKPINFRWGGTKVHVSNLTVLIANL